MINIRPINHTEEDFISYINIHNSIFPGREISHHRFAERLKERNPEHFQQEYLCEKDGVTVASIRCRKYYLCTNPDAYEVIIAVQPKHRNQGIGSKCYDYMMNILYEKDARLIVSGTREDWSGKRFLENRGFNKVMKNSCSVLYVREFNSGNFMRAIKKIENLGVDILSLIELFKNESNWKYKLWQLHSSLMMDVPAARPRKKESYEDFEKRYIKSSLLLPEAVFIAIRGDEWIGLSSLYLSEDRKWADMGLTGVLTKYRRQGIAAALKAKVIEYAKSKVLKEIETGNEENNPMYLLNLKLGFKPQPSWLIYHKKL